MNAPLSRHDEILTADRFDALIRAVAARPQMEPTLATQGLWGVTAIAQYLGCSDDFVRKLEREPGCPIRRIAKRAFVTKRELSEWLTPNDSELTASNGK